MDVKVIQVSSYGYDIFVDNSYWGDAEVGIELVSLYRETKKGNRFFLKRVKAFSPSGNLIDRIKKAVEDEMLQEVLERLDE